MGLSAGDIAPSFEVEDITGKSIRLSDYKGKKLLVCFYRYAGCPFCNVLLHSLIERYSRLHYQGLEVVSFIQSPKERVLSYPVKNQKPAAPFPMVADPERVIYDRYGVQESLAGMVTGALRSPPMLAKIMKYQYPQGTIDGSFILMPAFFLINRDQKVYQAYYGADFRDSIPEEDVVGFLRVK